jgi:ABC transporter substrate binding protein
VNPAVADRDLLGNDRLTGRDEARRPAPIPDQRGPGDPVAAGLAASLARPGGNATALTFEFPELSAKRLELLTLLNPQARRVLVIYDPQAASPRQGLSHARDAAPKLGLTLLEYRRRPEHHGVILQPQSVSRFGGSNLLGADTFTCLGAEVPESVIQTNTSVCSAAPSVQKGHGH